MWLVGEVRKGDYPMTECGRPRGASLALLALLALVCCAGSVSAADSGVLFITSNPPGVAVTVDGKPVGDTPCTIERAAPGEHTVAVVSPLYEDASKKVTVADGKAATAAFALVAARSDFTLKTDLVGLKVFVDERPLGVVEAGKDVVAPALLAGPHSLRLAGPFFHAERTFGIQKGSKTELSLPGKTLVGAITVSTTIPATALRVNGVKMADGAGPYTVASLAPGQYDVEVATTPYPYKEQIEVRAGETARIDLDATRDTGTLVISAVLDGPNQIRIDGAKVEVPALQRASVPPLVVEGIVKGAHLVEVFGQPKTGELTPQEEPTMMGRKPVWVPAGASAAVDFDSSAVRVDAGDACPPGMVMIPEGLTEGEFWFKQDDVPEHPAVSPPVKSVRALPMQGEPFSISPAGVDLTLNSVTTNPAAWSGRRDLSSAPLSDHTAYFVATAPKPFCIDTFEYPNRRGSAPVQMSYFDAVSACQEAGKRICTSVEWVRACSGPQKYLYPYGDDYQPARCNTLDNPRSRGLAPAGMYAQCVNGYGLYDMSGNAAEWTIADFVHVLRGATSEDEQKLSTPSLLYDPALKVETHNETEESPKLDYRGGSWMSSGWDASCRAMAPVAGNYIGTDDRPSYTEQLIAAWPTLDPEKQLPIAQASLQAFMKQWDEAKWKESSEAALTRGMLRGKASYVAALDNVAYTILRALGLGTNGSGGSPVGSSNTTVVDRSSGPQTRYLGSARLRGFRCCSYVRGPETYKLSASASGTKPQAPGQTGQSGQQGSGPAGAGAMGPMGPGAASGPSGPGPMAPPRR
jgi:hypothetical protein